LPTLQSDNVLVDFGTNDDAGIYRVSDDLAIVQTVDFFTPIVDDPYDFGRIAAANSFSDLYAMGATPISALNIVAFPSDTLPLEVLQRILQGGAEVAKQAGASILGGHSIKDPEPKYGMAATGTVHPGAFVTNANARPGDILLLTKQLGTGVLATALKGGMIDAAAMQPAIDSMITLNAAASKVMMHVGVHACTDITGYGLLGHAHETARASSVRVMIESADIPLFEGVRELIGKGAIAGGTQENVDLHAGFTEFSPSVPPDLRVALSDAQTSGGLLIAVAPEKADALQRELSACGPAARIGSITVGTGVEVA